MKKHKIAWMLLVATLFPLAMRAQDRQRAERINAQRVAFITEKLQLTPEEAQRFWPVYNEYRKKRMKLEEEKARLVRSYSSSGGSLTDEEAEKLGDRYVALEKQQADLLVEYHQKFKKVLPPKKVLMLYKAEKQFTAYLLRQIRDRQRRDAPRSRR